mmetsp:Transcript_9929/g.14766  ORF Transcript_9929/g.14766 Transcript_9929/m.14766 type:complete len:881 (-) Transcript_9929:297-2939(-)
MATTTSGVLYKRSEHVKRWRRRYFQLNTDTKVITYYILPETGSIDAEVTAICSNDTKRTPRGSIQLSRNALKHCKVSDKSTATLSKELGGAAVFAFEVRFVYGSDRSSYNVMYLAATSRADRDRWMHAIARTNRDLLPILQDIEEEDEEDLADDIPKEVLVPIEEGDDDDDDVIEAEEKEAEREQQEQHRVSGLQQMMNEEEEEEDDFDDDDDDAEAPTVVMSSMRSSSIDDPYISGKPELPQSNDNVQQPEKAPAVPPVSVAAVVKEVAVEQSQSPASDVVVAAAASENHYDVSANDNLYTDLPDDLRKKIDQQMQNFLQLCDEPSESWNYWFEKRGVTVLRREIPPGDAADGHQPAAIIRGEVIVPHSALQLFNAIANLDYKRGYEKHLVRADRVKRFNKHTFQDFLRYEGTWPTTPREIFCTVQWRILPERNNAIAMVGFSTEDDELCPMNENAIRAEVRMSGYLIIPVGTDGKSCKFIRISALDMKGGLPFAARRAVERSSAMWPSKVSRFLLEFEPEPDGRLCKDVTIENAYDIVEAPSNVSSHGEDYVNLAHMIDWSGSERDYVDTGKKFDPLVPVMLLTSVLLTPSIVWGVSKFAMGIVVDSRLLSSCLLTIVCTCILSIAKKKRKSLFVPIQFASTAVTILVPHIVWYFAKSSKIPYWEYCFLLSVLNAIRTVVLFFLGAPVKHATNNVAVGYSSHNHLGTGPVTCRFTVELKNMLQFVSQKKRQSVMEGNRENNHDVSVTHICVQAVAKALEEMPSLNSRRVNIPLLGIRGIYFNRRVDISVSTNGAANDTVKLLNVNGMKPSEVANQLAGRTIRSCASQRIRTLVPPVISGPLDFISELFDLDYPKILFQGKKIWKLRHHYSSRYCGPRS